MLLTVYHIFTGEVEITGTQEECQDFIAKYGGGWAALEIRSATSDEIFLYNETHP